MARRLAALLVGLLAVLGVGLALAGPAAADTPMDNALRTLQSTNVYNDPAAERALTDAQVASLQTQAANAGTPAYVTVFPASTGAAYGGASGVLRHLLDNGPQGTYAVVEGSTFIGGSNIVPGTGALATQALKTNGSAGAAAIISGFLTLVSNQVGSTGSGGNAGGGSSGSSGSSLLPLLGLVAVGGGALALFARRSSNNAKKRAAANLADVKPAFEEDVTKLGEELSALNLDIDATTTTEQMRQYYAGALNAYDAAKAALDRATTTIALHDVSAALEDGRYQLACVRALQAGEPLPERRAPCFFNPQHGPSVQDATWTPPGGAPRDVPVCAECADRLARGVDVDAKTVMVGGQQTQYWNAGPQYAQYAGGYYNGFGGMLPGILIGTVLGGSLGGFGGGYGWGGGGWGGGGGYGGDGGNGGGGGDWSFGGGDFGGGGGGGDFGGGGGGDFGGGGF
jgi:hypothetical protein